MAINERHDMTPYTEDYIEMAFISWYSLGCISSQKLMENLAPDQNGRVPSLPLIKKWRKENMWRERADVLNAQVSRKMEQKVVDDRIEMLERQAEIGKKLQERGMEFFDDKKQLTQENTALNMIVKGAEMERTSKGIPEILKTISGMKDAQLEAHIRKLLGKIPEEEYDELIDGDFKELPEEVEEEAGD